MSGAAGVDRRPVNTKPETTVNRRADKEGDQRSWGTNNGEPRRSGHSKQAPRQSARRPAGTRWQESASLVRRRSSAGDQSV